LKVCRCQPRLIGSAHSERRHGSITKALRNVHKMRSSSIASCLLFLLAIIYGGAEAEQQLVRPISARLYVDLPSPRAACEPSDCEESCKSKYASALTSASCNGDACECKFRKPCTNEECLEKCSENTTLKVVSAECQNTKCSCTYQRECTPDYCQEACKKKHPEKELQTSNCDSDGCQCVYKSVCTPELCEAECMKDKKYTHFRCAANNECLCKTGE
ncbi:unnamed protein product, partial [Ixodes persulcatus]